MGSIFKPTAFFYLCQRMMPYAFWGMMVFLPVGLSWGIFFAPLDYQQKEMIWMMYIHVPTAWFSLFCYGCLALSSLIFLVTRLTLLDLSAQAFGKVGTILTFVCLITGSLWGKPMWGTYWVWDARLTSMAILQFLFIGHWILRSSFNNSETGARMAALLGIFGIVNLPIIKWSVDFWATLHQGQSILKMTGPSIHTSFLAPLFVSGLGVFFYVWLLFFILMQTYLLKLKARVI